MLMLSTDDFVFGTGLNANCELGLGNPDDQNIRYPSPIRIPGMDGAKTKNVVAGSFSAALNGKDEIMIWGSGEFGTIKNP
jgi:alpha-tubulin suppressor-like RCC1 family protein